MSARAPRVEAPTTQELGATFHDVGGPPETDYRFSLANERTYLAWVRTALALVAGGVAAAKALDFNHEYVRWLVSAPPIIAGGALALEARRRWRIYEHAMRAGMRLPVGRRLHLIAFALVAYTTMVLVVLLLDQ
jgi:putative membrane protein